MKNILKTFVLFITVATMSSCSSDDDSGDLPVEVSTTYQLRSVSDPDITGTAKIIDNADNSVTIELQLNGTPSGGMHPAHIHYNTAAETGDIALTLGTVNGDTGFSSVTTTTLNDMTPITYEDLLDFDGYINVHLSANNLATLVAQGDIGQNELTGTMETFNLDAVAVPSISGTLTLSERVNGETLAEIDLMGTPAGGSHPAHIHMGSVANAPGNIAYTFTPVNGDTGMSVSNISMLDFGDNDASNDVAITYTELMNYDGYVNVHFSAADLVTLVAQGNIGSND